MAETTGSVPNCSSKSKAECNGTSKKDNKYSSVDSVNSKHYLIDQQIDRSMADQLRLSPDGKANSDTSSDTPGSSNSTIATGDYSLTSDDSCCYSQIFLTSNSLTPQVLRFTPQDSLENGNPGIRVVVGAADDEKDKCQNYKESPGYLQSTETNWSSKSVNNATQIHQVDPTLLSGSLPTGQVFQYSNKSGVTNGNVYTHNISQHHLSPGNYSSPRRASPNRKRFGQHRSNSPCSSGSLGIPLHSGPKAQKQTPSPVCQTPGQHIVHLHVNPGETISFQIGEQVQLFQGPATVRMVSNNSTPPVPMPVQVPPGHMVQQIVDENGTLRHIILSSQPTAMPPMPHMHPHHLAGTNVTPPNANYISSNSTSAVRNGATSGPTPFFGYPPPAPPFVGSQFHHHHHMQPGTSGLTPPSPSVGSSGHKSHQQDSGSSNSTGQHHHVHHHHHHHHGVNSCNTGHAPKTGGDQVGGYTGGSVTGAAGSTNSNSNPRDERTQKQFFRLKKKLEARSPKEDLLIFPPTLNPSSILTHPIMTATPTTAFFLSPTNSPKKGAVQAIQNILSKIEAPTIQNVSARECIVNWKPPLLTIDKEETEKGNNSDKSGIHENDLTYELFVSDKKIGPEIGQKDRSLVYSGTLLECRVDDLKPGTEYYFVVRASTEDISGAPSLSGSCRTECSEPDQPMPPKLVSKARTSLNLKWTAPPDNHSRISSFTLERDEGQGGNEFVEIFCGSQKQLKVPKLNPSTTYRFRLLASNAIGRSDYSEVVSFCTSGSVPSQPLAPTLRSSSVNTLQLGWQKRNPSEEDFTLQMEDETTRHGFLPVYNGRESCYTCTGLKRNSEYKFRLCTNNEEGSSIWSHIVQFSTLPDIPSSPGKPTLKGKIHAYQFRIDWDKPKDDGGSPVSSYVVEIDKSTGFEMIYNGSQMECQCDGLNPGTTYCIRVACSNVGGKSPYSETACITTVPICPGRCSPPRLHGKPKAFMLQLKWGGPDYDGGSPILEYEVSLTAPDNTTRVAYVGSETECSVAGLLPGRPYLFQVRATNRIGAGPWSESLEAISGAGPPDSPLSFQAISRSPHTILLNWEEPPNNGANITEYKVEWCQNNFSEQPYFIQLYLGPNHSYEAKNLIPSTTYLFRIQASNSTGSSPFSECVSCTSQASSPGAVSSSSISLSLCTATELGLSWKEPSSHGSPIIHYNVELTFAGETHLTTTTLPEVTISNLIPETSYRARVQATNNIGPGSFSSTVKVATKGLPPPAPLLTCLSASHNSLRLKWGDGKNPDLLHYSLEMENRLGSFVSVYQGPLQTHKIGKLQETSQYRFRIRASSDSGDGPYSDKIIFTTSRALPPALKSPKVAWQSPSTCNLEWLPVKLPSDDQVSYLLQLQSGRNTDFETCYQGSEANYQLLNLLPKTAYAVRICAVRHSANGVSVQGAWCPGTPLGFLESFGQRTQDSASGQSMAQSTIASLVSERKPLTDQQLAGIILCGLTLLAVFAAIVIARIIS